MDYMLYIIAGLILVLLVGVVLLRKNKAQEPPASIQPTLKANKDSTTSVPASKTTDTLSTTTAAPTDDSADKFDNLTVAQRFMDQQRYDKAIDTLKRGLIQKPHNDQLSLKLLSVYATLNETENFYKLYDTIQTHNDESTLRQANELKALLAEEEDQLAAQNAADEEPSGEYAKLDFDLENESTSTSSNTATDIEVDDLAAPSTGLSDTVSDFTNVETTSDNLEDGFDLTLSDLESSVDTADNRVLDNDNFDSTTATTSAASDDLSLDFNLSDQTDDTTASTPNSTVTADNEALSFNADDDFVLDLSDLDTDDPSTNNLDTDNLGTENLGTDDLDANTISNAEPSTTQPTLDDELTFSLDDTETVEQKSEVQAFSDDLLADPFIDSNFDESLVDKNDSNDSSLIGDNDTDSFDTDRLDTDSLDIDTDFNLSDQETISDAPVTADDAAVEDTSLLDEAFNFDSVTTSETTPTIEETEEVALDADTAAEYASRFNADFDFVKTLDSHQVTLDLAGQYLQLGEYDSAKRLLEEVVAHGNSDQQNQAQALLARTA